MGIGYFLGCFLSICLWNIDRENWFKWLNGKLKAILKKKVLINLTYVVVLACVYLLFTFFIKGEISNFITAFLVIDISNSERDNLNLKDRIKFYDSLSLLTESLLCGFITPLFYILVTGENYIGIICFIIYNISRLREYNFFNIISSVINIIPGLILQILYYIIYVFRNKRFTIDFKGDYLENTFIRPILNLQIMGAYIEGVNFYYHFNKKQTSYIKGYGNYNSRIDEECIKDYLSINYGISFLIFILFIVLKHFIN